MMTAEPTHAEVAEQIRSLEWIRRVRPAPVQGFVASFMAARHPRLVVCDDQGLRLYVHPFTNAGMQVIKDGGYETETRQALNRLLTPGDVFLDIGANEGILSAFVGDKVGRTGKVISVEPQNHLLDLIRINCALNGIEPTIINGAIGGADGTRGELNIFPWINSGASSVLNRNRFAGRKQTFEFYSIERIMELAEVDHFDVVKIDVEGFEGSVIEAMADVMSAGKVSKMLLDYHDWILEPRGLSAEAIHKRVESCGMHAVTRSKFAGYVVYERGS
jgi:FkbM family methyltransferase